jgi:hypothetical protein
VDWYLQDCGYQYARLQYQGWRYHDPAFGTGVEVPDLPWIKQGIRGYSSAWLNLGWYNYDAGTDQYTRTGGHWVTLVGYGHDSSLATPTYLIIHDPAWGDGSSIFNLYLFLERIDSGTLVGNYSGLPRSAVGYYKATRTLYPQANNTTLVSAPEAADFGILDGVVVLEMPETPTSVDTPPASSRPARLLINEGD